MPSAAATAETRSFCLNYISSTPRAMCRSLSILLMAKQPGSIPLLQISLPCLFFVPFNLPHLFPACHQHPTLQTAHTFLENFPSVVLALHLLKTSWPPLTKSSGATTLHHPISLRKTTTAPIVLEPDIGAQTAPSYDTTNFCHHPDQVLPAAAEGSILDSGATNHVSGSLSYHPPHVSSIPTIQTAHEQYLPLHQPPISPTKPPPLQIITQTFLLNSYLVPKLLTQLLSKIQNHFAGAGGYISALSFLNGILFVMRLNNLSHFCKAKVVVVIWLHANDRIVFSNSNTHFPLLCCNMESSHRVKLFENPDKIVGIKLDQSPGQIQISQHLLIDQVISKHNQEFHIPHIDTCTPLLNCDQITSSMIPAFKPGPMPVGHHSTSTFCTKLFGSPIAWGSCCQQNCC
ncbi:uncharacterized protein VP01_36g3 [Puccinia sorghi]|uniref:Uncharacterized protein n=1 Tax=Puccinia sorghi TaxID=27349 RepID=A0A0L6UUA7_9BASI|nr:uncharacterized protein VP01_36g3 [Puccinia sorghi]